ncbi:hypothetical protein [Chryseobacterium gwangjuense]|uniref:hypothetical protein n=1 Tax=Chryseobacterium gwangjuense TaxID=1069980 RepID=UPI001E4389D0|nr:hypothetical protein [Chryseobacterium gwangjuense]MCE3074183.1 hypothetical protein [Chryseobacterium gwangjuense]
MIEIVIPNFGNINIYKDKALLLLVKRDVDLKGKVTCEYYYENELFLKTISYKALFWKLKIENLPEKYDIKEIRNKGFELFKSEFKIKNNIVKIKDNPFYFLNKKMSRIFFNNLQVANVTLKNNFGIGKNGSFTQVVNFTTNKEDVIKQCLICYAISCNILNAG